MVGRSVPQAECKSMVRAGSENCPGFYNVDYPGENAVVDVVVDLCSHCCAKLLWIQLDKVADASDEAHLDSLADKNVHLHSAAGYMVEHKEVHVTSLGNWGARSFFHADWTAPLDGESY